MMNAERCSVSKQRFFTSGELASEQLQQARKTVLGKTTVAVLRVGLLILLDGLINPWIAFSIKSI